MTLTPTLKQKDELVKLFTLIDDLIIVIKKNVLQSTNLSGRRAILADSELITAILYGKRQGLVTLKDIYQFIGCYHRAEFPNFPSYSAFVSHYNQATVIVALCLLILMGINRCQNKPLTIMIGDSTPLPVCKNIRINLHKVCKGIAARSKTTLDWFYGFKLHLLAGIKGELLGVTITPGSVDDRVPVSQLTEGLKGIFLGDAGYCSSLLEKTMAKRGIIYLTRMRQNMKRIMTFFQNKLLNFRSKVESVISVLKDRMRITTSLPRSVLGHLSHYLYTLLAYEIFNRYV